MSSGGKREGAGRKKSVPTKKRAFYINLKYYDEIVKQIKNILYLYSIKD